MTSNTQLPRKRSPVWTELYCCSLQLTIVSLLKLKQHLEHPQNNHLRLHAWLPAYVPGISIRHASQKNKSKSRSLPLKRDVSPSAKAEKAQAFSIAPLQNRVDLLKPWPETDGKSLLLKQYLVLSGRCAHWRNGHVLPQSAYTSHPLLPRCPGGLGTSQSLVRS